MYKQPLYDQKRKQMRERKAMRHQRDFDPRVEYLQDFREPGNLARRRHMRSRTHFRVEDEKRAWCGFDRQEKADGRLPERHQRRMDMKMRTGGSYRSVDPHRLHGRHAHRHPNADITRRTTRDLIIEKEHLERRLAHLEGHLHAVKRTLRRRFERRNRTGSRMTL
jgi:hypothetical protein